LLPFGSLEFLVFLWHFWLCLCWWGSSLSLSNFTSFLPMVSSPLHWFVHVISACHSVWIHSLLMIYNDLFMGTSVVIELMWDHQGWFSCSSCCNPATRWLLKLFKTKKTAFQRCFWPFFTIYKQVTHLPFHACACKFQVETYISW
jgi:hypothetical protein